MTFWKTRASQSVAQSRGLACPFLHTCVLFCVWWKHKLRSLCDFDEYGALLPTVAAFLYSRSLEHILQMEEMKYHLPSSSPAAKPHDQGAIIAFTVSTDSMFLDSSCTWAPVVSVFLCCLSSLNKDVPPGSSVLSQKLTCIALCTWTTLPSSSLQLMGTEVGPIVWSIWISLNCHFNLFSSYGYIPTWGKVIAFDILIFNFLRNFFPPSQQQRTRVF